MSPEEISASTALARLRQEIADDRAAMKARVEDVREVLGKWGQDPPERPYLIMAAVALHAWYTGLEALLERVARQIDQELPVGDTWHRALLSQATIELPRKRPAVLPRSLSPDLSALLAFRHFFRHAYGVEIEPEKLAIELRRLIRIDPAVQEALDRFHAFLTSAAREIADE